MLEFLSSPLPAPLQEDEGEELTPTSPSVRGGGIVNIVVTEFKMELNGFWRCTNCNHQTPAPDAVGESKLEMKALLE